MAQQRALLLTAKNGNFEVGYGEVAEPRPGEVLIKVHAAGLNGVEQRVQETGLYIKRYPAVLGLEASGTVEKIGPGVAGFEVGDQVLHQGILSSEFSNYLELKHGLKEYPIICGFLVPSPLRTYLISKDSFFQGTFIFRLLRSVSHTLEAHIADNRLACYKEYTVCPSDAVAKVPPNITLDEAAGLPVALATAAAGLYGSQAGGGSALTPPWVEGGVDKYADTPIVVLGGAGTTGQVAIQFAKLSGFSPIITTASAHNESLLKSLGATHVLDRHSDIMASIASLSLPPTDIVYDAISTSETMSLGLRILRPGGILIHILPPSDETKEIAAKDHSDKQFGSFIWGNVHVNREVGRGLYSKLTELLASGAIRPNKTEVVPGGLRGVSDGLKRAEYGGLSATKLVIRPGETE